MNGLTIPVVISVGLGLTGFLIDEGVANQPWWAQWGAISAVLFVVLYFLFRRIIPAWIKSTVDASERIAAAAEKQVDRIATACEIQAREHKETLRSIVEAHNLNKQADREVLAKLSDSVNLMAVAVSKCPQTQRGADPNVLRKPG